MATMHMSENELASDLHAVLARVQQGIEVVIEQDHRAVAVLKAATVQCRKISEVIAALESSGIYELVDEDFARDVAEGINAKRTLTRSGRSISDCIASAEASASTVTLDGGFADDVEQGIRNHQNRWNPPS